LQIHISPISDRFTYNQINKEINIKFGCHRACEKDVPKNVVLLRKILENILLKEVLWEGGGGEWIPTARYHFGAVFASFLLLGLHRLVTKISGFRQCR
jgi:hypothetical protein